MNFIVTFLMGSLLIGCASAPSKRVITPDMLSGTPTKDAEKLKESLTVGTYQGTAGYSAEVMLFTEPVLIAMNEAKGKANLDSQDKIKKETAKDVEELTKKKTCFLVKVHTYDLQRSKFTNWVGKVTDIKNEVYDITFLNTYGYNSIPEYFTDMQGRTWHNISVGCSKKIDTSKSFSIHLVPQIKNNKGNDESSKLDFVINDKVAAN